eukprot:4750255-Lingulodinium_polyedra.AAC.1
MHVSLVSEIRALRGPPVASRTWIATPPSPPTPTSEQGTSAMDAEEAETPQLQASPGAAAQQQ